MTSYKVVLWDPKGEYWEGALVETDGARVIEGRGGATLPVDPKAIMHCGVGGYVKRGWGGGWPLDSSIPSLCCKMSLYIKSGPSKIHWLARVLPDITISASAEKGELSKHAGSIQIAADMSMGNLYSAPMETSSPNIQTRDLGLVDANGGWTISGTANLRATQEGIHAFALYGTAPGLRVAWAGLSAV